MGPLHRHEEPTRTNLGHTCPLNFNFFSKPFLGLSNIHQLEILRGSSDLGHFIFEINVGKSRIRHITALNLNLQSISSRSKNSSFNLRVVVCRILLFPTFISKIIWLGSELPLRIYGYMNDHTVWIILYDYCVKSYIFGNKSSAICKWSCSNSLFHTR